MQPVGLASTGTVCPQTDIFSAIGSPYLIWRALWHEAGALSWLSHSYLSTVDGLTVVALIAGT